MIERTNAKKRVLIVDDSSTMRAMLDGILSDSPDFVVVGVARGAKEAMMLLHAARPQIVMTDLCMPEMDGSGLLALLGERVALCKIVLSTRVNLTEAVRRDLAKFGAAAIFDKQEIARDPKAFLASLRKAADGRVAEKSHPAHNDVIGNVVLAADRFPVPEDELARARVVRMLKIENLDVDPRLNILVRHLTRLSNYPLAAINVIGADQLWVKAAVGAVPQVMARGETVCAHALCAVCTTVVGDLLADPVLRTLPMVAGEPRLRSYVGAPIISNNGARLGMVCVADMLPRQPTPAELEVVADVAALVASALQTPIPLRHAA